MREDLKALAYNVVVTLAWFLGLYMWAVSSDIVGRVLRFRRRLLEE